MALNRENIPGHPPEDPEENPSVHTDVPTLEMAATRVCAFCGVATPEAPVLLRVSSLYEIGRDIPGLEYEDAAAVDGWACLSCLGVRD